MGRRQVSVALYHRDDADCPEGPRHMMSDEHRVGCAAGRECLSPANVRGGAIRGEYYARVESAADTPAVRVRYLCARCGPAFATQYGLPLRSAR